MSDHDKCQQMVEEAIVKDPHVKMMIASIEKLGCKLPESFFACRPCDDNVSGGFAIKEGNTSYEPKIIVCENSYVLQNSFLKTTLLHELVSNANLWVQLLKINSNRYTHMTSVELRLTSTIALSTLAQR